MESQKDKIGFYYDLTRYRKCHNLCDKNYDVLQDINNNLYFQHNTSAKASDYVWRIDVSKYPNFKDVIFTQTFNSPHTMTLWLTEQHWENEEQIRN